MLSTADLTFLEEVVTDTAEDFELLDAAELTATVNTTGGLGNDFEDVVLEHRVVPFG